MKKMHLVTTVTDIFLLLDQLNIVKVWFGVYVVIAPLVAAEHMNSEEEFLWNSKPGTVSPSGGSGSSQCHSGGLLLH